MLKTFHYSKIKISKNSFLFFFENFQKKIKKIIKISVSNFCFPIYIGLYICLSAFEKNISSKIG